MDLWQLVVVISVLLQQSKGDPDAATIRIQQASPLFVKLGTNTTLQCVVMNSGTITNVRWYHEKTLARQCRGSNLTEYKGGVGCDLLINPVTESSEGEYECKMYDGMDLLESKTLQLNVSRPYPGPSIELLDLSTGNRINDSKTLCIQRWKTRTFECTITDAKPEHAWSIAWLLWTATAQNGTSAEMVEIGDLVNVSSRYTVKNPGDENRASNLSCLATSSHYYHSLNATVQLQFCGESEYAKTVLRVLVSICVTATIATIITHILLCKYYGYI